jgi:uncharacterized protein (DUF2384 family)
MLAKERTLEVERQATTLSVGAIAKQLQANLGQALTAHLAGLSDTRQIGRIGRGEHRPQPSTARRLREGYKAVSMIAELYDWETAKAWLFGTNTRLDDQAPVEVLGTATTDEQFTDVARAAKQFASADG